VQKTNHKITAFALSHFRSLKLSLKDAVHCVHARMTRILHIGLETGEFLLRRVTILDESIVALANERVDLLEGDSQSLPCHLLTEHLCNLGEVGISRDAGKTRVDLDNPGGNSGRLEYPNRLAAGP
jgi:hypothetical protein